MAPEVKAKKAKQTSKPKTLEKPSKLSAEYIVDSDEAEDQPSSYERASKSKTSAEKATKKDSKKESKKATVSKTKAAPPSKVPPPSKSNGPKINGSAKSKQPELESSESSEDTETEDKSSEPENTEHTRRKALPSKSASTKTPTKPSKTTDGTAPHARDSDSSESESEQEESDNESHVGTTAVPLTAHAQAAARLAPEQVFVPPFGFARASVNAASTIKDSFASEGLKGKQIWHITAPSSLPLSKIKDIASQAFEDGSSILSFKGAEYGFSETESKDASILVPASRGDRFEQVPQRVARVLNLHQIAETNRADSGHSIPEVQRTKPKPEQPQGLKMRYRPFGDVDSETEQPAPEFRMPLPVHKPRKEKRKANEASLEDGEQQRSPKKKRGKDQESPELSMNGNQTVESQVSTTTIDLNKRDEESPEEKAERKAAKAKRKEQKKKRKEEA